MSYPANPRTFSPAVPCHIFKFPSEITAETLSWLTHPDILSLSQTCKRFYNLLVDSKSVYIWKRARERFAIVKEYQIVKTGQTADFEQAVRTSWVERFDLPGKRDQTVVRLGAKPIPAPLEHQSEYGLALQVFGQSSCFHCTKDYKRRDFRSLLSVPLCTGCNRGDLPPLLREQYMSYGEVVSDFEVRNPRIGPSERSRATKHLWAALPKASTRLNDSRYIAHEELVLRHSWDHLFSKYLETNASRQGSETVKLFDVKIKGMTERNKRNCKQLLEFSTWLAAYGNHLTVTEDCIRSSSERLAISQGLVFTDMELAPAYKRAIVAAKQQHSLNISQVFIPILPILTTETLRIQAERISSTKNAAQKIRKAEIEALYKKYPFPAGVKPTLDTFRSVPILQAFQRGISTTGVVIENEVSMSSYRTVPKRPSASARASVQDDLKNTMVLDLVDVAVTQWKEGATHGARKLLGFGRFKGGSVLKKPHKEKPHKKKPKIEETSAMDIDSTGKDVEEPEAPRLVPGNDQTAAADHLQEWHSIPGKLDPEMRVTSWFVCTRCVNLDPGYKRLRVLDFRGLCGHECYRKDRSHAQKQNWNIDCFALAPRAIDTAKRMLEILKLDAEDEGTTTLCLEGWWTCNNCPAWMNAMVWEDLLRHCQRHEHQDISQVSEEEVQKRKQTINSQNKRLSFADLLSGKHETEARTKQLACVHCRPTADGDIPPRTKSPKAQKVMDIHGIRQHMKTKHRIADCRNEDYYYTI